MAAIGWRERILLPDYRNTRQIKWGTVGVDDDRCNGCGVCVRICPSDSLYMQGKKAMLKPTKGFAAGEPGINQCMCCGDCAAICSNGAISILESYTWTRYFKTLGRGKLSGPRL